MVKSTLLDDTIIFLRDVLRQNLTDPAGRANNVVKGDAWIFKSRPEKRNFTDPVIILDEMQHTRSFHSQGRKANPPEIIIDTLVWSRKTKYRDELADQIINLFSDRTSADSAGNKILSKHLVLKNIQTSTQDAYFGETTLFRLKRLTLTWSYVGV